MAAHVCFLPCLSHEVTSYVHFILVGSITQKAQSLLCQFVIGVVCPYILKSKWSFSPIFYSTLHLKCGSAWLPIELVMIETKIKRIQVIAFFVTLNLVFLLGTAFFFVCVCVCVCCPKFIDAFLLDVLHGFLMDDDLEFCLVMELIIFVPLRKNGFSEKFWIKFNFLHWHQLV